MLFQSSAQWHDARKISLVFGPSIIMSTWSRPVLVLLCGLLLLTVSIAVLNTLVPLWLTHDALPTWQVGMVSSSYYCGNLLGTLIAGWVI